MKWRGQRQSSNVEDRRSSSGSGVRGLSLGTIVVVVIIGWLLGINPLTMLGIIGDVQQTRSAQEQPASAPAPNDEQAAMVSTVLASTEDVWSTVFRQMGRQYEPPRLVLFRGAWPTACGMGQSAMGPFYCPADRKVYIDLGFFQTMHRELGAPGEFAQAYVIAHEVGHHVQDLLGITAKTQEMRQRMSAGEYNAVSVRVELQADCFAGVWAHYANRQTPMIEDGDIEAALNAASKIGDDTLQRRSQGTVVPESFTHGTSAQRVRWFRNGWEGGSINRCDTFSAQSL